MVAISTQQEEYMAFRDFSTPDLINRFNIKRIMKDPILQCWLTMPVEIAESTQTKLEELRDEVDTYELFYNQATLEWFFLIPLLRLVNYRTEHYRSFVEMPLRGEVEGVKMRGTVDFMVAAGEIEPTAPYFFLHEYKKEKGTADDVLAQLLSAMLVAQERNDNGKPIYGCYMIGRLWHFVVLNKKEYSISQGNIASTTQGITEIYTALVNMKKIIETELI